MKYNPTFKSFIGIPGGSETQKCFYPLKVDTYGRGCSSDCVYCYAKSTMAWRKMWDSYNPATSDFDDINKLFVDSFSGKKKGKIADLIRMKYPVRLGGMTDCFALAEKKSKVSLKLLKLLKEYQYPYLILTKNNIIAEKEYMDALQPELAYIQFSITTPYDEQSRIYESGASSTSERLEAAKLLSNNGFTVAGRICPLFPIYPDGYYSLGIHQDTEPLKYFDWSLVDLLADAKCKTVIAGFLRLNYYNNNRQRIIKEIGFDLDYLFSPDIRKKNDALYFSIEEKRYYYEKLMRLSHERGMRFTVCYDGDESYDVFRYLWENQQDCCDAPFKRPIELWTIV